MVSLNFQIVGAGAVGLATGYLLSRQGHGVVHQSVRGRTIAPLRVSSQIDGVLQRPAAYRPRSISGETPPADYVIFAAEPRTIATFLNSMADHAWLNGPKHLVLASVVDPEWRDLFIWAPFFRPQLAFPIMSCECLNDDELTLITDMQMDVLEPPSATSDGPSLSEFWAHSDFRLAETVNIARFAARHLLTASIYINLLAIHRGSLTKADVSAKLLYTTLNDLVARFELCHPWQGLDFPPSVHDGLAASAELIRTSSDRRNLLQKNICTLLNEGMSKLESHLHQLNTMMVRNSSSNANATIRPPVSDVSRSPNNVLRLIEGTQHSIDHN